MLKRLRWQLTLLYSLAALALVAAVALGSFGLLRFYFNYTTDLALQYKLVDAFQQYHLSVPAELLNAQENWTTSGALLAQWVQPVAAKSALQEEEQEHRDARGLEKGEHDVDPYDGQLASVFMLAFSEDGEVLSASGETTLPFASDQQAYQAAMQNGKDWRTVRLQDGSQLRLLTYRTNSADGPAAIQVGRLLSDQDRVLGLFLLGLIPFSALVFLLLSVGGWLISGRTLGPAQKAWEQQQAFVSNASHELRTPLTILRSTAEMHLRLPDAVSPAEGFESIIEECDYMNRMVDDLLLLSRLDAQRLQFHLQSIDLDAYLHEIQDQFTPLAQKKGVVLQFAEGQGHLWADPDRLRQVLLIVLDNALRFTPPGETIQVEAQRRGKQTVLHIRDHGPGVSAEHLPHLFERFYQVPHRDNGEGKSNGLGLSIAQGLVEAQGGKIALHSQAGQGTEVLITFPTSA